MAESLLYFPHFTTSKQTLASFKATSSVQTPYVQTGIFLPKGKIVSAIQLCLRRVKDKKIYPMTFKPHSFYPDHSIRFGLLTAYIPESLSQDTDFEIIEQNTPVIPEFSAITLPNIAVKIISQTGQEKTIFLKNAQPDSGFWIKNSLTRQKRYRHHLYKGFSIDFDVQDFHQGGQIVDVIFNYNHLQAPLLHPLAYQVKILHHQKILFNSKQVVQQPYQRWRKRLFLGMNAPNTAFLNWQEIEKMGFMPALDFTAGVAMAGIQNAESPPIPSLVSQDVARYVLTGNPLATQNLRRSSEQQAHNAWTLQDPKTGQPPLPRNAPDWELPDIKRSYPTDPLNFYWMFIITGDRYYYDALKHAYMISRFISKDGRQHPFYSSLYTQNLHAYGRLLQIDAEMNILQDAKQEQGFIDKQNAYDNAFLQKMFIERSLVKNDVYDLSQGEISGILQPPSTNINNAFTRIDTISQDMMGMHMAYIAQLSNNQLGSEILAWQMPFLTGKLLQPSQNPFLFLEAFEKTPLKLRLFSRWQDALKVSNNTSQSAGSKQTTAQTIAATCLEKCFALITAPSLAYIYRQTKNIKSLEAYLRLMPERQKYLLLQHQYPAFFITMAHNAPIVGDGKQNLKNLILSQDHAIVMGGSGQDRLVVTAPQGASIFTKEGDDRIIIFNGENQIFAGDGDDTINMRGGYNILQGDDANKKGKDIFKFSGSNIGRNIITDFTIGVDKIQFSSDTGLVKFAFNNRLEGLAATKREYGVDAEICKTLSKKQKTKNPNCVPYATYLQSNIADNEFFKEIKPEIPADMKQQEQILRKKLKSISFKENPRLYRQTENDLRLLLAEKLKYITKLIADSRYGNKEATRQLNSRTIRNQGVQNYFRTSSDGGTLIDLDINVTPTEHMNQAKDPLGYKNGFIEIKNVPPQKFISSDFIFSEK